MRGLKKLQKPIKKKLTKYLPLVLVAGILALVTVVLLGVFGWMSSVPGLTIPLVGRSLRARTVAFVAAFAVFFLLGFLVMLYRAHSEAINARWRQLSKWSRATIAGFVSAVLVVVGTGVAVFVDWAPLYALPVGFLLTWPLATGLALQRLSTHKSADQGGVVTSMLTRTGYQQLIRLETRTLAGIIGFVVAVVIGLVTWYFADSLALAIGVALLLWFLLTVLVFERYENTRNQREDLLIVEINEREEGARRELSIKNIGDETIDLTQATIRDTEYDTHQLGIDASLSPGETCTFEILDDFSLKPNDSGFDLPLGFTVKQGIQAPIVYTRTGEEYVLQQKGLVGLNREHSSDEGDEEPSANAA